MVCFWTLFGIATILYVLKDLGLVFWRMFRAPKNLTSYGRWAIVTGATDGIGQAVAFELASKKMNVLLVSRTESKLQATSKAITAKHPGVEVEYLAIDYSKFDSKARASVAAKVKGLEGGVGVLVNNVGMSYSFPKFFDELADEDMLSLLDMNVSSVLWMTRIVLPDMVSRKSGCVVNISSASSLMPCPLLSLYASSKAYVNRLTESLALEYENKGVHFQSQVPLYVTTKLAKIRKPSFTVPTPEQYAKASVSAMGHDTLVSPYWVHAIMVWLVTLLPAPFVNKVFVMGPHLAIRKKGMKKEAEKSKGE